MHPHTFRYNAQAIERTQRALDEMVIAGVVSTIGYHKLILSNEYFIKGDIDTGFIVKHAAELLTPPPESNIKKYLSGSP